MRNNKQMFFDDNCREGKRSVESRLVKHSLVDAAPPASLKPSRRRGVYAVIAPGSTEGLLVSLPLSPEQTSVHKNSHKLECQYSCLKLAWKGRKSMCHSVVVFLAYDVRERYPLINCSCQQAPFTMTL